MKKTEKKVKKPDKKQDKSLTKKPDKKLDKKQDKLLSAKKPDKKAETVNTPSEAKIKTLPDKKPVYILCTRCDLNYFIPSKKDKYCKVCLGELGFADKSILLPDEEEIEKTCPVCKINLLGEDESICFVCIKDRKAPAADEEKDWSSEDIEEEKPSADELEISLELAIEEEEKEEDDLESDEDDLPDDEPDDFDYDVDPSDFEDDDEDEKDEDDDEDDEDDI